LERHRSRSISIFRSTSARLSFAATNRRGGTSVRNLVAVKEEMFFHLPSDLAKDLESSGRAEQLLTESGRALRAR